MNTAAFVVDAIPRTNNKLKSWKLRHWERLRWTKLIEDVAGHGPWRGSEFDSTYPTGVAARVGIVVHRRREQDKDNAYGSVKPVLDSLKRLGWIVDDSPRWCLLEVWEHKCEADEESTWIVIEYLQGAVEARTLEPAGGKGEAT